MIFASDLDNTLIYSYKKADDSDICVENKDGKALSFMTPASFELLKQIAGHCEFVPITTRSVEQYKRIRLPVNPKYAIVCNGAVLLKDGEEDAGWTAAVRCELGESLTLIREYYEWLLHSENVYDVRNVDGCFIFAKFSDENFAVSELSAIVEQQLFEILVSYNKIYIMPKILNKGAALERLKPMLSDATTIVCAGDSKFDIPMFNAADTALVPTDFEFYDKRYIRADASVFSEFVLNYVRT